MATKKYRFTKQDWQIVGFAAFMIPAVAWALLSGPSEPKGRPIAVPSDPGAQYAILSAASAGPLRTITTRREGRSGTTYAVRQFDCGAGTVRYLATGDTLESLKQGRADESMAPIMPGTIADDERAEVCR